MLGGSVQTLGEDLPQENMAALGKRSLASDTFKTRGDKATTDLPGDGVIPGFCLKSH